MIWDRSTPCKSCPYRRDSKRGLWHPTEFVNLLRNDHQWGAVFGCHEFNKRPPAEHRPCAGWLLDQQQRGLPNLNLRILLLRDPTARACFAALSSAGLKLYRTIKSMCRANGVG